METYSFKIRKSFLLPLGLVMLLTLVLLLCCILLPVPLAKTLILAAFTIPVIALFIESALRRVSIDDKGVQIDKPLRSKRITALQTVWCRQS